MEPSGGEPGLRTHRADSQLMWTGRILGHETAHTQAQLPGKDLSSAGNGERRLAG